MVKEMRLAIPISCRKGGGLLGGRPHMIEMVRALGAPEGSSILLSARSRH